MLELKGIKKDYPAGDSVVHALKGIDLKFRDNEFVSILGPSGCGKTTTLNIIGGLDQYSDGDLIINGRSTKDFNDRDWDSYRNHSIGFVFQSYNLIPHQTVLQNVELALTLSGVSKAERKRRAKEALEKVGLGSQLSKKPSEMSGGQMQRVAIARAIVNNPDIILADEPTGALDSETSIQVMDILKEISKDKLIIMVTHNPELAEQYSTRIIRMLDGEVQSDSKPVTPEEYKALKEKDQKLKSAPKAKKPSMSFNTAFGLSLKNLFTKKGRTALTSFAGSIGIIGVALIFAVSQGMTTYINTIQEDTLSSYPLTIEATNVDMGTLMETFVNSNSSEADHENDAVYQNQVIYDMLYSYNNLETEENDLKSFKTYLDTAMNDEESELSEAVNGISYTYDMDMMVYAKDEDGTIIQSDLNVLLQDILLETMDVDMSAFSSSGNGSGILGDMSSLQSMSPMASSTVLWEELLAGDDGKPVNDLLIKQYDVVYGSWPSEYDEIVLVVDENNELDDLTLYALGLKTKDNVLETARAASDGEELSNSDEVWSYEDICSKEYVTVMPSDCYQYDEKTGLYTDLRDTEAGLSYLYDNGIKLKVTGIIRQNEDTMSPMLSGSIGYTSMLTEYIVDNSKNSLAIKAQKADPTTDIFTGLPFADNKNSASTEEKAKAFRTYVDSLDRNSKADMYVEIACIPTEEVMTQAVDSAMSEFDRTTVEKQMIPAMAEELGMDQDQIQQYVSEMSDDQLKQLLQSAVEEQVRTEYESQVLEQIGSLSVKELAGAFDMALESYTEEQCASYYDEVITFSDSTYEDNLKLLGDIDLDSPSSINLYASSFDHKDIIEDEIAAYNDSVEELQEISYVDYVGLMMSAVTSIINAITYVLIAFVAVSLIVSSIMIGVITLISVQERTKEIGILRAIGASKRNVSSMFNAETVIIGFISGLIGVVVTYLLCIPINAILHSVTGIATLNAVLPIPVAIILIVISMLLTLISGLIPSKSAAKKDPVVALRSE